MKQVELNFKNLDKRVMDNKISAIRCLRQAGKDFLFYSFGLKESKDIMDDIMDLHCHHLHVVEVPDHANVMGFLQALHIAGFEVTSPQFPVDNTFNTLVITAVQNGNYKYALELLKAHIKFGGAYDK